MPLGGPESFVPTTNGLISHWEPVNLALGTVRL